MKQVLNNGETHGAIRGKINDNFTELYDRNASDVPITDAGNYYTGTDTETALQEVGAHLADMEQHIVTIGTEYPVTTYANQIFYKKI